jgi:hypothetical protein
MQDGKKENGRKWTFPLITMDEGQSMKLFKLILSLIITIASVILCQQLISNSISNQKNKADYAELNDVKYGLLSVDEWKGQITAILTAEINKMDLSGTNERDLRKHVEVLLNTLIDKIDKRIREENSTSAKGWVKQSFINIFVSLDDIKKGVPEYADAIIHEIQEPKTMGQIKTLLNKQLEQYSNRTFNAQDTSQMSRILLGTGSKDIGSARIKVDKAISVKQNVIFKTPCSVSSRAADSRRNHAYDRSGSKNFTDDFCVDGASHPF